MKPIPNLDSRMRTLKMAFDAYRRGNRGVLIYQYEPATTEAKFPTTDEPAHGGQSSPPRSLEPAGVIAR